MFYIICCLLFIFIIIMGGSYYCFREAFYSDRSKPYEDLNLKPIKGTSEEKKQMEKLIRSMMDIPYENVEITSFDGLKLRGKYYKKYDTSSLVICFHGYKGTACRDFSGGGQLVLESGYNLILIDERAHGESEGNVISFGVNERLDVVSWCRFADECLCYKDIVIAGISMGATAVLMASELELPASVRGILADCPFNSPVEIIKSVAKKKGFPGFVIQFGKVGAKLFGHFDVTSVTAADAVKKCKLPVIIIHGLSDTFVPEYMSREIAEVNPERIRRYTFPNAEHGLSYFVDLPRYSEIMKNFLEGLL